MRKICGFLGALLLAGSAQAITIYAPNNLAGGGAGANTLISFDSANPAGWVTVGSMGPAVATVGIGGLDFAGNGQLYGYASYLQAGGNASGLYSVNKNTGLATLVGNSGQTLQDLAWDPVAGQMLGINALNNVATLYSVNLANGATAVIGNITGLPATNLEVGLAVDSAGNRYVHDIASDRIFKGAGLNMTSSILLTRDTNFSQGMTIDWSRNDAGYHGTIGSAPGFFSHLYGFPTSLASWNDLGTFGTPDGTFPTVETGDLAIEPVVPEPATLGLVVMAGGLLLRRRS